MATPSCGAQTQPAKPGGPFPDLPFTTRPAQLPVSHFRFKVFADYEAYVACQARVDQLYRVRFLGPGREVAGWDHVLLSRATLGSLQLT